MRSSLPAAVLVLGCLTPPRAHAPAGAEPEAAQASVAGTRAATHPTPPPRDDPRACVDAKPVVDSSTTDAARAEEPSLAEAVRKRLIERSPQVQACAPTLLGTAEVDLMVEVGSDGATRARVLGTSLTDCAAIRCVREELSGLR